MIFNKKCIKHFFKNTTFPCCQFLSEDRKFISVRIFWWAIFTFFASCIVYITYHIIEDFKKEAVFVTLSPSSPGIDVVSFPGVAICNLNILSRTRTENLIEEIYENEPKLRQHSKEELLKWFRLLGNQHTFSISGSRQFNTLQKTLQTAFKEKFDISIILKNLSTPCSELISDCHWNQKKFECKELFQTRLTDSGFCCVFNNIRPIFKSYLYVDLNETKPDKIQTFHSAGEKRGLSVVVYNNESDYLSTFIESKGVFLKIFSPYDFADQISGTLQQILVQPDVKALITIDIDLLKTFEPHVRRLPQEQRHCRYRSEGDPFTGERYSQSDCLVACRLKSILSMCDCAPFMEPTDHFIKNNYTLSTCEMIDVPCLNKYQGKWSKYYAPEMEEIPVLRQDAEDSLWCDCLPNCIDTTYKVETNFFRYNVRRQPKERGTSQISIYTTKAETSLYTKTVTVTWYEGVSALGGLLSLFLGMSLLHIGEILVLLTKLLFSGIVSFFKSPTPKADYPPKFKNIVHTKPFVVIKMK